MMSSKRGGYSSAERRVVNGEENGMRKTFLAMMPRRGKSCCGY
jgi:hypothetical protein